MSIIQKSEYINPKKAQWVLDNIDKINYRLITDYKYDPLEQVKNLCNKAIKTSDGNIITSYTQGKGSDFGRFYVNVGKRQVGYQTLLREFRHTLAYGDYDDVDIVNCQPTILAQYCKKNNIVHDELKDYVKNRDEIMISLSNKYDMTRTELKSTFIQIIMGGHIHNKLINNKRLNRFYNEIQIIQKSISELNSKMYDYAKNRKNKTYNINGTVTAYLLQDIENKLVQSCDKFLTKNGYNCDVLIFDGVMVRINPDKPLTEKILDALSDYVKNETEYRVKFLIKTMDEGFKIKKKHLENIKLPYDDVVIINNDKEGSDHILKVINDTQKLIKSNHRYFWKIQGNIYKEDLSNNHKDTINKLVAMIGDSNICKKHLRPDGTFDLIPYSKNATGAKAILTFVLSTLEDDETFIDRLWNSTIGKICFNNGYYTFKNKVFTKWDESDHSVITTIFIKKDYDSTSNLTKEKKIIYDKILDPIISDPIQQKHFLRWISQAIAGMYNVKTWAVGLGNRNCGKGVLTYLLMQSFEKYVREFNSEEMICTRIGNGDMAKKLGWLIPFEFSRLNISNELKTDDGKIKTKLDGNIIKSISSGGDTKTARQNFKDEIQFKIQGKMLLMMNEMIPVDPIDALETITTFKFTSQFKPELSEEDIEVNNVKDSNYKYYIADQDIKEKIVNNQAYQMAFIHLILEHYQPDTINLPDEMKELNNDYHDKDNTTQKALENEFLITRKPDDKMSVSEVDDIIKNSCGISKSAYKLCFEKMGIIVKVGRDSSNKSTRYYIGLKKKIDLKI